MPSSSIKKLERLDKKLHVLELNPQDEWSYHFWFGIKCGYPICCIIWYCDSVTNQGKQEGSMFDRVFRSEFMDNPNYRPSRNSILPNYNQCPDCLLSTLRGERS